MVGPRPKSLVSDLGLVGSPFLSPGSRWRDSGFNPVPNKLVLFAAEPGQSQDLRDYVECAEERGVEGASADVHVSRGGAGGPAAADLPEPRSHALSAPVSITLPPLGVAGASQQDVHQTGVFCAPLRCENVNTALLT